MSVRLLPLLVLSVPALAAPRVGVIVDTNAGNSSALVVAQLQDSEVYDFDVVALRWDIIASSADLAGIDVVVVGSSGFGSNDQVYNATLMAAIADFHAAGGGVIASSWMSYEDPRDNIQPIVPIDQTDQTSAYCTGASQAITATTAHPVVDGLTTWTVDAAYAETPGPLISGAVALATCSNGEPAVIVRNAEGTRGRQVYLGQLFFGSPTDYNNDLLRSGPADRLLEQAVAWASGVCPDEDGDGFSVCSGDCDDTDPDRFPDNPEVCDGKDNDCDGEIPADEADDDEDGVRVCEGDCDDADPENYPGNPEVCDGKDNDCDGEPDNGLVFGDFWPDADGDGFGDDAAEPVSACATPEGFVGQAGDCDDADPEVNPDAEEIPGDGIDNNCDGEDAPKGCGCATAPGAGWLGLALLLPLVLRRRR